MTKTELSFSDRLVLLFEDTEQRDVYRKLIETLWFKRISQVKFPAVIGISGAQGTGKTTLAGLLVQYAHEQGVQAAAVSLDDYYLSQQQRSHLALNIHPLFSRRGMPGTHRVLQAIDDAVAVLEGQTVSLPQFDKALDQPAAPKEPQQLSLLIVEGWCLGLIPQSIEQLRLPYNQFESTEDLAAVWRVAVNQFLATDYPHYWDLMNLFIWLKAPDWQAICRWRSQQEHDLWQKRGLGMNDIELDHFMQTFARLTNHSFEVLPDKADIIIELDQDHQPMIRKI
jgi:D-glycerate 3-kinase